MLTPQEVGEHTFAKAGFGGYQMNMVDEFLDEVTEDYGALYKENAALKAKMKVLADRVEEYRATDDAMRKTLLAAQNMADEMVREAEGKKAQLLEKAEAEAKARMEEIHAEIRNEEARLSAAQTATAEYLTQLREIHRKQVEYLGSLDQLVADPEPRQAPEDQV